MVNLLGSWRGLVKMRYEAMKEDDHILYNIQVRVVTALETIMHANGHASA